jgi:16S rRNA (uracil1498-N3)-methyltransferase
MTKNTKKLLTNWGFCSIIFAVSFFDEDDMPRFFISDEQIRDGVVTVTGDDAHHISRSLRMAAGEHITVCDTQGKEYDCKLTDFLPDRVLALVEREEVCQSEPPYRVHILQALPKGDKLDSIIQKAVECGAFEITTFESERCVVRAKDASEAKKLDRRARIASEAAKQCGRGIVPTVHPTVSFSKAVELAMEADIPMICYEGERAASLPAVLRGAFAQAKEKNSSEKPLTVSVMIGSEGGFSPKEAASAVEAGVRSVGLGKRILRTETAAAFVLACLSYEMELSK